MDSAAYKVPRRAKFIETDSKIVLTRAGRDGKQYYCQCTEFLFGLMEKSLEMDSTDGCTTLSMGVPDSRPKSWIEFKVANTEQMK